MQRKTANWGELVVFQNEAGSRRVLTAWQRIDAGYGVPMGESFDGKDRNEVIGGVLVAIGDDEATAKFFLDMIRLADVIAAQGKKPPEPAKVQRDCRWGRDANGSIREIGKEAYADPTELMVYANRAWIAGL